MGKTKSKDDKRDKFICSKCGHSCGNKGALAKHKGSEACKRRQRKQKTLKAAQPKKKKHVKRSNRKRSKSQKDKISISEQPKAEQPPKVEKQAGALTTLPPAPASDTPEIPDEMEELHDFTHDLAKNLREEAVHDFKEEIEAGKGIMPGPESQPEPEPTHNPAPETTPGPESDPTTAAPAQAQAPEPEQKGNLWPWLVGGAVLVGGLIFAAVALLSRRGEATPEPEPEQPPEPDPSVAVDPWAK